MTESIPPFPFSFFKPPAPQIKCKLKKNSFEVYRANLLPYISEWNLMTLLHLSQATGPHSFRSISRTYFQWSIRGEYLHYAYTQISQCHFDLRQEVTLKQLYVPGV